MDDSRRTYDYSFANTAVLPPVDVYETTNSVVVVMEIAGATPESLQVRKEGDVLRVTGERIERCDQPKRRLYHMEIAYGRFERSVVLPEGFDAEGVRAVYERGILSIEFPRSESKKFSGRIPVE